MRQPARLAAAIRHFSPTLRTRPHPTTLKAVVSFFYAAAYSACRSHAASSSHLAPAAPAPRASLRQSRASPRGCCRVRPHPSSLKADVSFFYAAACSACRSHAAFSSHLAAASPAHRASLRQSRASPVGCCRVRPHPTTLKADVSFFYAAACSACRRQRGFVPPPLRTRHLTPSGCVTSHPADASPHTQRMRHRTPSGCVTSHPADASPHTQRMRHLTPKYSML